ncbi:hypothetical protein LUX73_43280 [Actinomadura madurae]|nr:hypothetical protein [Actinomadura madurae]MCQ0010851.1 hypothetical protein [Actinomadura madurae]
MTSAMPGAVGSVATPGRSTSRSIAISAPHSSPILATASPEPNSGTVRTSMLISAWSGTRFGCTPAWKVPTFTVTGPWVGLTGQSRWPWTRVAAAASAARALRPSSGREPCAETPRAVARSQSAPLCPRTVRLPVGSATTSRSAGAGASGPRRAAPSQPVSSPKVSTSWTGHPPSREARTAAAIWQATPAFMSLLPRPSSRPPRTSPPSGSNDQPDGSAGTVSRCPVNVTGTRGGPGPSGR